MTTIEELLGYMDDCNPDVLERRAEYLQGTDAEGWCIGAIVKALMTAKEEQGNRRLQVNMQADDAVLPPLTLGQMVKKLAEGQEQSQLDLHLTVERVKELETIVSQIGEQLRF